MARGLMLYCGIMQDLGKLVQLCCTAFHPFCAQPVFSTQQSNLCCLVAMLRFAFCQQA